MINKLSILRLEIGQVADTLTVTGEAPLLENDGKPRRGHRELRVTELPLNGRNPIQLHQPHAQA